MTQCDNYFGDTPCKNEAVLEVETLANENTLERTVHRCIGCAIIEITEQIHTAYQITSKVIGE